MPLETDAEGKQWRSRLSQGMWVAVASLCMLSLLFKRQGPPPWPPRPSWRPQLERKKSVARSKHEVARELTVFLHVRGPEGKVVTEELHDEGRVPGRLLVSFSWVRETR